jgi:carbonic anhydrase
MLPGAASVDELISDNMCKLGISFGDYLANNIEEKTLLICCSDFYLASESSENKNVIMYSSFANSVHPEQGFHADMLNYHIETDKVKQIIVVGHFKCEIIKFLISEDSQSEKWALTKDELKETMVFLKAPANSKQTNQDVVKLHVINQLLKLQNIPFIKNLVDAEKLKIGGIVVDETNNNQVIQLKTSSF